MVGSTTITSRIAASASDQQSLKLVGNYSRRTVVRIGGRLVGSSIASVALYAALLFGPAHTWKWPAAWALLGILFVSRGVSTIALYRGNRELLRERTRLPLHREQAGVDRILLPALLGSFAAQLAFVSFDHWRLHLLPALPLLVRWLGLTAFVVGWYI